MAYLMSAIWLMQDPGSLSSGNSRLLMILVGMVAAALAVQAIALIAMAVGVSKALKSVDGRIAEIGTKLMPLLHSTHDLVEHTSPKIKTITDNLAETSTVVRAKAQEFEVTASDLNKKTRAQADRVNDMVNSTLDTISNVGSTLERGVKAPLREVSGLFAGLKAGIDVLTGRLRGTDRHNSKVTSIRDTDDPGW